jgi:hypothetical protein
MQASDYIGSAIAGLIYFALGIRLLRLGMRARSAPERLLGLTFLLWTLYYELWTISIAFQGRLALETQISIAAHITGILASVGFAFFPLLVFRRGVTWAKWLVASALFCLLVGAAGSIWIGDPAGVKPLTNGWWWPAWLGEIATAIWIGVEGLHHYGMTRPRVRLGLCEPIVAHCYLLWGLAGIFWTLLDFVVVGQYVDIWARQTGSTPLDILVGCFEIAALAMVWLAYFAPASYLRRINASAVSA